MAKKGEVIQLFGPEVDSGLEKYDPAHTPWGGLGEEYNLAAEHAFEKGWIREDGQLLPAGAQELERIKQSISQVREANMEYLSKKKALRGRSGPRRKEAVLTSEEKAKYVMMDVLERIGYGKPKLIRDHNTGKYIVEIIRKSKGGSSHHNVVDTVKGNSWQGVYKKVIEIYDPENPLFLEESL